MRSSVTVPSPQTNMIHDNMKNSDSNHSKDHPESVQRPHCSLGEDDIETIVHHLADDPLHDKLKLSLKEMKELRREWDQARALSRRTRNKS